MAIRERTHDISLIDHHVRDLDTLCETLNQALSAAFPKPGRSRYRDIYVLLLSWENDDLGVASEIDELEDIFRHLYRYRTRQWKIPTTKSHNTLSRRIMRSLDDFDSTDKLLIVYYGGHGYMNEDRQCVWLCNQQPKAATVQWSSIQTNLEEADSDVLVLLDCCAAASSAGGSGKGITELIAACGFEDFAPGVGEHSFTRSLIEELRYYAYRPGPISTAFLHNKVLARAKKSWNPRYAIDGSQERRKTPIHIHLADSSKQRCIELTPLPPPPLIRDYLSRGSSRTSSPALSTSPSEEIDSSNPAGSSQTSLSEVWPDPGYMSPKVLISVALEDDQFLRGEDMLEWLKTIPALAKSVHIESVYKSDSTLLLLSLPVALWDLIPEDPAISFVAFVKSRDLANPLNANVDLKQRAGAQGEDKYINAELLRDMYLAQGYQQEQVDIMVKDAERKAKGYRSPTWDSSDEDATTAKSKQDVITKLDERTKRMDLNKPTYIKVSRIHLSPETLDMYGLPWEFDTDSSGFKDFILIKQWIPQDELEQLFAHTRMLRQRRLRDSPSGNSTGVSTSPMNLPAHPFKIPFEDSKNSSSIDAKNNKQKSREQRQAMSPSLFRDHARKTKEQRQTNINESVPPEMGQGKLRIMQVKRGSDEYLPHVRE